MKRKKKVSILRVPLKVTRTPYPKSYPLCTRKALIRAVGLGRAGVDRDVS